MTGIAKLKHAGLGRLFARPEDGVIGSFSHSRRRDRFGLLLRLLGDRDGLDVLDLGGSLGFWQLHHPEARAGTFRNIEIINPEISETSDFVFRDGCRVICHGGDATSSWGLRNDEYGLVFSNSVIEHVGNLSRQKLMSDLVREVGNKHFIQTPCRSFPIEPHFHVPFFQYMPLGVRVFLHRKFRCGFMGREKNWLMARVACEDTRLMTLREIRVLFPESQILPERFLGLVKSWMITDLDGI